MHTRSVWPALAVLLSLPVVARAQGPMGGRDTEVVARFDKNGDKRLDADERKAARAWLKENRSQRGGRGGFGGPGGPGGPGGFGPGGPGGFGPPGFGGPEDNANAEPKVGGKVAVADAPTFPGKPFYDQDTVRTLFLTFAQPDWFEEMGDFYRTDVDLPATLVVDGVTYADVGVHFRGNTSYMMARGKKKSLHISFDYGKDEQRVLGYRSTNLINGNEDPSGIREALNAFLAGRHGHALQANLVRLVINGEDLGVYVNLQHFNKDFLEESYGSSKGARFKVPPDFSGNGALRDLGDDVADYQRNYIIKSDEDPKAWTRLKELCQLLEHGTDTEVVLELPDYLDIDDALWFLAVDNATLDGDGYYSRGSDYALWLDKSGRFHPIARDGNEVMGAGEGGPMGMRGGRGGMFPGGRGGERGGQRGGDGQQPPREGGATPREGAPPEANGPQGEGRGGRGQFPGGPGGMRGGPGGMRGGPRSPSITQPALAMLEDQTRPLVRRLLSVPLWRERYLWFLHTLATDTLDDAIAGARLESWRQLIDGYKQKDVHALSSYEAFTRALAPTTTATGGATGEGRSLRATMAERRKVLLADPSLQGPWPQLAEVAHALVGEGKQTRLRVTARATGEPRAQKLVLHISNGKVGAFAAVPMLDDGQHDDGAANDGVFGATSAPMSADRTIRYYVEALLPNGRAACSPAEAGGRPTTLTVPGDDNAPKAKAGKDGKDKKQDKD